MTRILFVGDLHIREGDHLDDVEHCLNFVTGLAYDLEVDAVIQVGDVFEKSSNPHERLVFGEWLRSLEALPVHVVRGNHDAKDDLRIFEGYPNATVYQQPMVQQVGNVDVMFLPWPEKAWIAALGITGEQGDQSGSAALNDLIRLTAATRDDLSRPLLIAGHLTVSGAEMSTGQPLIGKCVEAALPVLEETGAAFVGLGHIHKPQSMNEQTHYIGSLTIHDFGEQGEEKRVAIVDIADEAASWEFVPVPTRTWITVEASIDQEHTGDISPIKCPAPPCVDLGDYNVRFRYRCTAEEAHLFDHATIEDIYASAHTLKIVPEIERTERVRAAEVAEAKTLAEKLAAWGQATDTSIPESAVEKLGELQEAI
ncbi:MAG: hypothetical protein DRJ65_00260 [Acidobacteria bacterium]|nr:MAG: hypothetical protein DRJ65_00260 [Acidobacteriota bacterium]